MISIFDLHLALIREITNLIHLPSFSYSVISTDFESGCYKSIRTQKWLFKSTLVLCKFIVFTNPPRVRNRSNYRFISISLVFLFTITLFNLAFSASPIKTGQNCKAFKQTKTYQGMKFTCIKLGKKLVWSKGITARSPSPTPTATPKPSAAPSTSPTPSVSGSSTPTASPTPSPTPKNLTPLEKLNQDIYERYLKSSNTTSPHFNFVLCPSVNKDMADLTMTAYKNAYSFWSENYTPKAKVNWL